jgi:asparagine synthase (glutamine-hydrolysing)
LDEVAVRLGRPPGDAAQIYAEAVARWGDQADRHIVGDYCAIVMSPSAQRLRLSRSPITAPPLTWYRGGDLIVASSVPRVIFASGVSPSIDFEKLAASLSFDYRADGSCFYQGLEDVPLGAVIHLGRDGVRCNRWYGEDSLPAIAAITDEDALEQAERLIADAVKASLAGARKPGVTLSGGLDSPLVALEVLRQLPAPQKLPTFTFVPDPEWDGIVTGDMMGDERPIVEAFAGANPRIEAHFYDNSGLGFDARLDELLVATGYPSVGLPNLYLFHGPWEGAREAGCDMLLDADWGNQTFSNEGRYAFVEFFLRGQWKELYLVLKNRPGDSRSVARKFLSLTLLQLLPDAALSAVVRRRHRRASRVGLISALRDSPSRPALDRHVARSRRAEIVADFLSPRPAAEAMRQGFEQLYGMPQRSVPTYRPLAEFCMTLPTRMFARHGEQRWLARQLLKGRVPEGQRNNRRYGQHSVDWHVRLGRQRGELRRQLLAWQGIPQVAQLIDIERLLGLLDEWPPQTDWDPAIVMPRGMALPRAIAAARFIDFVSGRNAL